MTYECQTDYSALEGDALVTCLSNGSWSAYPRCHSNCHPADLTVDVNATLYVASSFLGQQQNVDLTTSYPYGSSLTFSCADGMAPGLLDDEITCGPDGQWSADVINCTGTYMYSRQTLNQTFLSALKLVALLLRCDVDVRFIDVDCGDPPIVANATMTSTSGGALMTSYGATVEYACDDQWSICGENFSQCLSNSSWTQPPTCYRKTYRKINKSLSNHVDGFTMFC